MSAAPQPPERPLVSVVIPAHNAAATLGETLDSLLAQSHAAWEAIVVNDGSADDTGAIADSYAARDPRVRVVAQAQAGEGGARNAGVAQARGAWLLFLDADDWMAPHALERFLGAAGDDIDAVVAGWVRVTADGTTIRDPFRPDVRALFPTLAQFCPFAIHSVLVRRAVAERAGPFARDLAVGADWDFWQRVARGGARFTYVDDVLAFYRVRPQSAAVNVPKLVEAGRRLIALGHDADPRVREPDPAYAAGLPREEGASAFLRFVCWPAGILIGAGGDAAALLDGLDADVYPDMEPSAVAQSLFSAALLPDSLPPSSWLARWPVLAPLVERFAAALQRVSGARDLARRVQRALERLVLEAAPHDAQVGTTRRASAELTAPVADVAAPDAERLVLALRVEGEEAGGLELPVCDGLVPGAVIADAAADQHAWTLLGRFFARTVYRTLETRPAGDGEVSVWRGAVCLAERLPADDDARAAALHDAVGWTVFLQELWGEPGRPTDWFYAGDRVADVEPDRAFDAAFDVAAPVNELRVPDAPAARVALRVGGAMVGWMDVPAVGGVVAPEVLRARANGVGGYELVRAAVRVALVGRPLGDAADLRARLAAATEASSADGDGAPAWVAPFGDDALLLARHAGPVGSAASRRAALPVAATDALLESAAAAGETVVQGGAARRVLYVPELFRPARPPAPRAVAPTAGARTSAPGGAGAAEGASGFDRHHFETLFAGERDPWSYATPFEELKYEQTIALIEAAGGTGRVLELACAEGMFTERLAPRVGELLATDIAQIAVDRTAARCARLPNVSVARLDIARDPIPRGFDTIVCSEVLYYLGGREAVVAAARKMADALAPGGRVVTAHCNVVVDDPTSAGLDWDVAIGAKGIGEVFSATPGLRFVRELRTPLYRVQLFERVGPVREALRRFRGAGPVAPAHAEDVEWKQPAPHVAARFLMNGGEPRRGHIPAAVTYELPILMYHSIAPGGDPRFARYRLAPDAFEAQLRYLREAGFRGVTLDEWRQAKLAWQPLPGRAVMLTFDDGFRDFAEHAWPLLKRYGFGALVFLVTDHVGGTNAWDAAYGEPAPLLDWDAVRRLRAEGVEFGSHTARHPFLTAGTPADVVREAARSRAALLRELGGEVTAFAYPHGAEDPAVQHLVGACGYTYGLSCRAGRSTLGDPLLALRRIEVRGTDALHDFIAKLG